VNQWHTFFGDASSCVGADFGCTAPEPACGYGSASGSGSLSTLFPALTDNELANCYCDNPTMDAIFKFPNCHFTGSADGFQVSTTGIEFTDPHCIYPDDAGIGFSLEGSGFGVGTEVGAAGATGCSAQSWARFFWGMCYDTTNSKIVGVQTSEPTTDGNGAPLNPSFSALEADCTNANSAYTPVTGPQLMTHFGADPTGDGAGCDDCVPTLADAVCAADPGCNLDPSLPASRDPDTFTSQAFSSGGVGCDSDADCNGNSSSTSWNFRSYKGTKLPFHSYDGAPDFMPTPHCCSCCEDSQPQNHGDGLWGPGLTKGLSFCVPPVAFEWTQTADNGWEFEKGVSPCAEGDCLANGASCCVGGPRTDPAASYSRRRVLNGLKEDDFEEISVEASFDFLGLGNEMQVGPIRAESEIASPGQP